MKNRGGCEGYFAFCVLHFACCIFTAILLLTGCRGEQSKGDQGENHRPPSDISFDEHRAYALLERQCTFGPRYPGSPGHAQALEWLSQELSQRTDHVLRQTFEYTPKWGKTVTMTNLIASFAPEQSHRLLLCAHWDTRPWADRDPYPENRSQPILGANDGASGVAVLLEVAEVLKQKPPQVGVDIVLFDGEDYGRSEDGLDDYFAGSRYFAQHLNLFTRPRYAILIDMVGDADLDIYIERNSQYYAPDIVDRVWSIAESMGQGAFHREIFHIVFDDHIPLNRAGIPAIDIIDFDYPYWHTLADTPDKCRPESLKAIGDVLLQVIVKE